MTAQQSDAIRYAELVERAAKAMRFGQFPSKQIWREIEEIKNRNGGKVPQKVHAK